MKRPLIILGLCTAAWTCVVCSVFVYVDRKVAQAAGWFA